VSPVVSDRSDRLDRRSRLGRPQPAVCVLRKHNSRDLYTPVFTLVLVIGLGHWLSHGAVSFNPLKAAQNGRISFQSRLSYSGENLTEREMSLAKDVDESNFPQGSTNVLYLGDSQVLGIFDSHGSELTSPQWLQVLCSRDVQESRPVRVRVGALPGAGMAELLAEASARYHAGERIGVIVLSLLPDELHNIGFRPDVVKLLRANGNARYLHKVVSQNEDLRDVESTLSPALLATPSVPLSSTKRWVTSTEDKVDDLADHWPLFRYRDKLRSEFSVAVIRLRNWMFRIERQQAPPVPQNSFAYSSEVLELLIRVARSHHTDFIIYEGPLLPWGMGYYSDEDLTRTKRVLDRLCKQYNLHCFDYRNLIPLAEWGDRLDRGSRSDVSAEPVDFVHLSGEGHRLLGQRLFHDIRTQIVEAEVGQSDVAR
jgi:hypothetical protein